jgi:hypothetical protein
MPIIDRTSPSLLAMATGSLPSYAPPEREGAGFFGSLGAAFRRDNIIGSTLANVWNYGSVDPRMDLSYNPWSDIAGTGYEAHWDRFVDSPNADYSAAIKTRIDQENTDRQTLEGAGWGGFFAQLTANALDPTMLIPVGGVIIKSSKGVYKIADVALRSAIAGGIGTAVQEVGLQTTQETRTAEESAYNIGGGIVLGGLLGAGVSAILSRADRAVATDAIDRLADIDDDTVFGIGGLSAAPAGRLTVQDLSIAGASAGAVANATQFISPNLRLNNSPSPMAREVGQRLAESSLYQEMHAAGRTLGPSVERLANMTADGRLAPAIQGKDAIFSEMRKAGVAMTRDQFEDAVGRAMRVGDAGENEFIDRAARLWRAKVVDPFFEDGKAAGLYDDGDQVAFAQSYFPRMYRREVLVAKEQEFKDTTKPIMAENILTQYRAAQAQLRDDLDDLERQVVDLNASPKQRAVSAKVNEQARIDLEAEYPELADIHHQISDVRRQIAEAKASGDKALREALEGVIERLRREAGKEYAAFERKMKRAQGRDSWLRKIDPKRVPEQLAEVAAIRAARIRAFFDEWEIKKLGENIDPFDPAALPNFKEMASEIVDDVYQKLTARDYGASASVHPEYMVPIERGPVRERTFPIPDQVLEALGVLENNAGLVLGRYARVLAADVELTRAFGDPRLDKPLKALAEDYQALREGVTDPKKLKHLKKREDADRRDLEALRDLVRGTYKMAENTSGFGRLARIVNHYNFIRSMGGVTISSLTDLYRPAMVQGLSKYMAEGLGPLVANTAAFKMSVKEAQLAGTVVESVMAQRLMAMSDLADPLARRTPVENAMENMSRFGGKWSGLNLWNDFGQSIVAVMTQSRILKGSLSSKDLAFLGIDGGMATRIGRQFALHGDTIDGVPVANTEMWDDIDAVRHFRAAVGKEVDRTIVKPGVGDVPLFAKTPLGKLMFQFKSYVFASHQKVLIAGLQGPKANLIGGMIAMTAMGMMVGYLKAWRSGAEGYERFLENAKNPGYLIGEGLDQSGIFALPFDFANTAERLAGSATGYNANAIKTPLALAGRAVEPDAPVNGMSQRFVSRGPFGTVLGPTAGLFEDGFTAAGGGVQAMQGKEVAMSRKRAAARLLPYNSFLGMKEMLQVVNEDSPYLAQEEATLQ